MYLNNYNCSLSQFTILQFVRKYTCLIKKYDWNWFKEKTPRFFFDTQSLCITWRKIHRNHNNFLNTVIYNRKSDIFHLEVSLKTSYNFWLFSFGYFHNVCNAKSLNFLWYLYIAASFNWQNKGTFQIRIIDNSFKSSV